MPAAFLFAFAIGRASSPTFIRPRDEFDPSGSPALMPATPAPARTPDVRTVGGMTIDLDVWRDGPRAAPGRSGRT